MIDYWLIFKCGRPQRKGHDFLDCKILQPQEHIYKSTDKKSDLSAGVGQRVTQVEEQIWRTENVFSWLTWLWL